MTTDNLGSQRFQRALKSAGAKLLAEPICRGSFYCHAVIARGGQGTVFLGTGDEQARSRVCVIKTFNDLDRDTLVRADRSIRTQLSLLDKATDFPNPLFPRDEQIRPAPYVPDILAWDLDSATPWVAQEFRGPSLRRRLAGHTARGLQDRRSRRDVRTQLWSQIVSAVQFIHMHGVIHRDLKPDNILVEGVEAHHLLFESVALCDFDLSKSQNHTTLTRSAVGMGTPGYSAPEQLWLSARNATAASDVYAVGMLAVFLFTGREPREAMTGENPMQLRLHPALAQRLGSRSEWVEQALSFMPEDRPSIDALHPMLHGPDADR